MPKIDVIDEAVIDAPLMVAFNAILDEYSGSRIFGCRTLNSNQGRISEWTAKAQFVT
jgi:hypothetical protein